MPQPNYSFQKRQKELEKKKKKEEKQQRKLQKGGGADVADGETDGEAEPSATE